VSVNGNICISSNNGCPDGYQKISPDDLTGLKITGDVKIHVVDAPSGQVEVKLVTSLVDIEMIYDVSIDSANAATKLNFSITKGSFKSLSLSNINIELNGYSEIIKELTLSGSVCTGETVLNAFKVNVDKLGALSQEVIVRLKKYSLLNPQVSFTNDEDGTKTLAIGKRRVILTKDGSEYGLSIRSKYGSDVKFTCDQKRGSLEIRRYGNPEMNDLFSIEVNAKGGIIKFADQTWKNTKSALSDYFSWLSSQNFIKINQEAKTEIHLAGREVPVSIENKITEALQIICDKQLVGIQGNIKVNTANDKVVASVSGELEFSFGKLEGDFKLNFDSNIAVSLPDIESILEKNRFRNHKTFKGN
jgi:hypothetical protein